MTNSEYNMKQRLKRAERRRNGLCTSCGKPVDRDGALCTACLEAKKQYNTESRERYISVGLCPICKKNEIFGIERSCRECRAKASEIDHKRTQQKIDRNRRVYNEQKALGHCPRCNKPKEDDGYSWCSDCRAKRRKWANRKEKQYVKAERISQGLCPNCASPNLVPGKKLCYDCYRISLMAAKKAQENRKEGYNDTWKKTNMKMRGRFRRIPTQ